MIKSFVQRQTAMCNSKAHTVHLMSSCPLVRLSRSEWSPMAWYAEDRGMGQAGSTHPIILFCTHNSAGSACVHKGIRDRGQAQEPRTLAPGTGNQRKLMSSGPPALCPLPLGRTGGRWGLWGQATAHREPRGTPRSGDSRAGRHSQFQL